METIKLNTYATPLSILKRARARRFI